MRLALLAILFLIPGGCAPPGSAVLEAGRQAGFRELRLATSTFELFAMARRGPGNRLTVYIEGDGRAFVRRNRPADDPTPGDPVALRLALVEPEPKVLWLARPCQFPREGGAEKGCDWRVWTVDRYGPAELQAMSEALDQAKTLLGASRLALIGHSGGGSMALLLAAARSDVDAVVTLAGNLDHAAWTDAHGVTPLSGSLNPANLCDDSALRLAATPQAHVVGGRDEIVPRAVVESYARRVRPTASRIIEIPQAGHEDWPAFWPELRTRLKELDPAERASP